MENFKKIKLNTIKDPRGSLTVLEDVLPFTIVRSYWIYETASISRGGHRHKKTWQAFVAIKGTVSVFMSDGDVAETCVLSSPDQCLIVEPKDWHSMDFEQGSVLLVFASAIYDENDYVYQEY